jgi:hypothetical protein
MTNRELIEKITEKLDSIHPGLEAGAIRFAINDINRAVNRLNGRPIQMQLVKKLAADLLLSYNGELAFQKSVHHNSTRLKVGEGFFKSMAVLRKEILTALEKAGA